MADRSFAEQLLRESDAWVADGLVTADQAAALRNRYVGIPAEEPRSRAAAALGLIGAIAVGFGVVGFVAANWDAMSHGLRLALLTGVTAASYAAAFQLRERTGKQPRLGEALYLLGVLLFGASLFLVGQMYNVQAHDPLALLLWAAGATAIALAVRSPAIAWAAVLIFTGWVGFELAVGLDDAGGSFAAFPALAVCYGGALYGLGTSAVDRIRVGWLAESGFPGAGRRLGLLIAAGGLFVFTFAGTAEELGTAGDQVEGLLLASFLLVAGLALVGAGALALTRMPSRRYEGAGLAVVVAAALVAVLAGGNATFYALLFNLLFAAVALGALYVGYLGDEPWLVNLGVVLVAIDLVARYFDVFWSALPRSVGMIGAGVLVLTIAYALERQRKRLLARMSQ